MTTRIKLRRDTAANWLAANPILSAGEPGLETDTGKIKYGDGVTAWETLPHAGGDVLSSETAITVQTGDDQRWLVRLRREDDNGTNTYTGVFVNNVLHDSDGNIIVTALVELADSGQAVFKFDASGNVLWKWSLDGYSNTIYPQGALAVDSNNDVWLTVYPDAPAIGLIKLDGTDGTVLYTKVYSNDNIDLIGAAGSSIVTDSNNDVILAGGVGGDGGPPVIAVAKIVGTGNNIGDITWQKQVLPEGDYSFGLGVAVDYADNIIVTGTSEDSDAINRLVVIKFDTDGNWDWQQYVELGANDSGQGSAVVTDAVGNMYVTGTLLVKNPVADNGPFQSSTSNAVIIVSLDSQGAVNWSRRIGPGECSWVGTSIDVGDDGDLYLVASTVQLKKDQSNSGWWDPTIVMARYDAPTGAVKWQKYFNNPNAQDLPAGSSDNDNWSFSNGSVWAGRGLSVYKDKVVIGGSTRMGVNDIEVNAFSDDVNYFNQGFLAQFDTDASEFNEDGYQLETSRVPGKLENGVHTVAADMTFQDSNLISPDDLTGLQLLPTNISVRKNATKSNTWTFERNGDLNTPADTSIKLNQTQLGYVSMYGEFINYDDDVWYQSVVRDDEGFVYTLGSNDWTNNTPYITKFSPSGDVVWEYELRAGEDAGFYISWTDNVYTVEYIDSNGYGYKVGDKITLGGSDLGGNYNNNLVLNVDTINSYGSELGSVASVSIVSGTAPDGSGSSYAYDYLGISDSDQVAIKVDPVTKNLVVAVTIPTWGGDELDSGWTQSLIMVVDSDSGALLSTTVLSDDGDVYVQDVAVSASGNIAVAGQKFNEYALLTANGVSVLSGSTTNELFIAKSDFTSEHIPGDGTINAGDCWVTGTNITDQVQLSSINRYYNLPTTVRQGSGSPVFDVTADGAGAYTVSIPTTVLGNISDTYLAGATGDVGITINSDNIVTVGGYTYIHFTDSGLLATVQALVPDSNSIVPVQWDTGSTSLTGYIFLQYPGDGSFQFFICGPDGGPLSGTYYFPMNIVQVTSQGTNYLVGHQLKITGDNLGGATPTNDAIVTVTSQSSGAITGVSITGTSTGSSTYTGVSGTNYNVGSGAVLDLYFNFDGSYSGWSSESIGSNYVVGDVLTIAGTQFAGGESPADDVTVTVTGNSGGSNGISDIDASSASVNSDYIVINTYGEIDYSAGSGYAVKQNLGGEAFVWRPGWEVAIGGPSGDGFNSLAYCSDESIVAVGYGQYEVSYTQGLVVKYNSTGTLLWSNQINPTEDYMVNHSVVTLGDDSVVIASIVYDPDSGNYPLVVTRVDTDGSIVWQNLFQLDDDGYPDIPSLAVDTATDEIIVTFGAYLYANQNNGEDSIYILKLDADGEVLWKRALATYNNTTYQLWNNGGGRAVSIAGDKFTLCGYTYATVDDYSNAVVATLPLNGTGTGVQGIWQYFEIEDYKVVQVRKTTTEQAFEPHVNALNLVVDDSDQYYTLWPTATFNRFTDVIRDERGGAIEFADGSKQAFSATTIPQIKPFGDYRVRPEDSGKHIYVADNGEGYTIYIPHWQYVTLPVGFTLTIVNRSDSTIYLVLDSGNGPRGNFYFSGGDTETPEVGINDNGSGQMVTIMKIEEGSDTDYADNHGDRWMIAGADIYDNW